MVSFRSHIKLEARPDTSPLGVDLHMPDEHLRPGLSNGSPPPGFSPDARGLAPEGSTGTSGID